MPVRVITQHVVWRHKTSTGKSYQDRSPSNSSRRNLQLQGHLPEASGDSWRRPQARVLPRDGPYRVSQSPHLNGQSHRAVISRPLSGNSLAMSVLVWGYFRPVLKLGGIIKPPLRGAWEACVNRIESVPWLVAITTGLHSLHQSPRAKAAQRSTST